MTVVGRADSLAEARARAYDRVRRISFNGVIFRTDIAEPIEEHHITQSRVKHL